MLGILFKIKLLKVSVFSLLKLSQLLSAHKEKSNTIMNNKKNKEKQINRR